MTCERCCEIVSARLDGEASASESALAAAHLLVCRPCRHVAGRMRVLQRRLGALRVVSSRAAGSAPVETATTATCDRTQDAAGLRGTALVVGAGTTCGCDVACRCGCQQGARCRCEAAA